MLEGFSVFIPAVLKQLDIHYVKFFSPLLDLVKAEEIARKWPGQIVLVHADVVHIVKVLWEAGVQLAMPHPFDFLHESQFIEGIERDVKITQLKYDAAETPNVCPAVIPISPRLRAIEDLRTLIEQRTHILHLNRWANARDPEISDLHLVIFSLQKNIAGLDVPMNNFLAVQIVDGQQNLDDESLDSVLRELKPVLVFQIGLKVSFVAVVE